MKRAGADRLPLWLTAAVGGAPLAFLSFGLAVVVWVFVTNVNNPTEERLIDNVRIEARNRPDDYLDSGISPVYVSVTITGPRNVVRDLKGDSVKAWVDLRRADEEGSGEREFAVNRPIKVDLGDRSGKLRADPFQESAKVTLERQEQKTVRVKLQQVGVLPVGWELEFATPEITEATVVGARRNIESVDHVTADMKLDGLTVSGQQSSTLTARGSTGNPIGGVRVDPGATNVNVRVLQKLYPRQVAVFADLTGRPRTGYQVTAVRAEPQFVTVVGPLDQVNLLSTVLTEAIDIEGADRDLVRPVRLKLQGVTASEQAVRVTVSVQLVRAPGSIGVVPRVLNLRPGLSAALTTPVVAVNLSGPLADVVAVRTTDVAVTVDAGGLGPGTHRLDPKVVPPPTLQVDAVVPDKVEIVITQIR